MCVVVWGGKVSCMHVKGSFMRGVVRSSTREGMDKVDSRRNVRVEPIERERMGCGGIIIAAR